jgi:hypothetical protein
MNSAERSLPHIRKIFRKNNGFDKRGRCLAIVGLQPCQFEEKRFIIWQFAKFT